MSSGAGGRGQEAPPSTLGPPLQGASPRRDPAASEQPPAATTTGPGARGPGPPPASCARTAAPASSGTRSPSPPPRRPRPSCAPAPAPPPLARSLALQPPPPSRALQPRRPGPSHLALALPPALQPPPTPAARATGSKWTAALACSRPRLALSPPCSGLGGVSDLWAVPQPCPAPEGADERGRLAEKGRQPRHSCASLTRSCLSYCTGSPVPARDHPWRPPCAPGALSGPPWTLGCGLQHRAWKSGFPASISSSPRELHQQGLCKWHCKQQPPLIFRLLLKDSPVGLGWFTTTALDPLVHGQRRERNPILCLLPPLIAFKRFTRDLMALFIVLNPLPILCSLSTLSGARELPLMFAFFCIPIAKAACNLASQPSSSAFPKMPNRGHVQSTGPKQSAFQGCAQMSYGTVDMSVFLHTLPLPRPS